MPTRPEIFISAASRDLKSCRQLVRDALLTLGCVPVVQDHFPPGAGEVREMLRERIAGCQAVIHIAGECYGFEPQERDPAAPRRSYTQLEYDIARELKRPLYTFLCAPDFPYDTHDSEPTNLRALQDAHRASLAAGDHLYLPIKDPRELSERVRELQTRVETLARDLHKTRSWLGRGIAAAALALLLVAGLLYGVKREGEAGQVRAEARAAQLEQQLTSLLQQQTRLTSLVTAKIKADISSTSDPAAAAREDTARQLGISVEDLQKQLVSEKMDVQTLLTRIDQASAAAETNAAAWRALRRDALLKMGDTEFAAGYWGKAIDPYQQALALSDKDRQPIAWCDAAQKLEVALWRMWRNADAEPLAREIVEKRTAVQGSENPATLAGMHSLVGVLLVKGDLAGAETLGRRTLEIRERILGKEHPDTLASLADLAYLQGEKHDQPGAEVLFRRCLEARERTLGKDHPDTLETVNDLAASLMDKGDFDGAEALDRRCLEARARTLGDEHRFTLWSRQNLAYVLAIEGKFADAEPLFRQTLEARERTQGKEDPDTLNAVSGLSYLLSLKHDQAGAEALDRRRLEAFERTMGKEHPGTLDAASDLADDLMSQGKLPEAETLFRRVLTGKERARGKDDIETLQSVSKLAQLMDAKNDEIAAEALFLRAQTGLERAVPPNDPLRLDLDYYLSLMRQKQHRLDEALPLAEHAVAGAAKILPVNNPTRLGYEKNLAELRTKLAAATPAP